MKRSWRSVAGEHPRDGVRVASAGQCQRQQNARFLRVQVVRDQKPVLPVPRPPKDPPRSCSGALHHDHALGGGVLQRGGFIGRGGAGRESGRDDAARAGRDELLKLR